ncbi:hypothetical protein GF374_01320 [Candidatus Woesearchaeota archaeon]|nr:hypothetical protein [Candidatus Woesearchaeota archaeon]
MAIESTIWGITLGLLASLVLLRYSGFLDHVKKAIAFIAAGVLFYIIDIAWNAGTFATKIASSAAGWLTFVWELVAFILIIVGAIWGAAELIIKTQ